MVFVFKNILCIKRELILIFSVFLVLYLGLLSKVVQGQSGSYKIQVKDRLQISFWDAPELNSQGKVSKDGGIDLPIIGRITAAGLTINQLREKMIEQMTLYNKVITQLSVVVLEYGSNLVYVTGQVRTPGKYSFEEIPNLWDILLEAGGPLETAMPDEVIIIRSKEDGKMYTIDLAGALRRGRLSELPKIYPGDTIHVPGTTDTGTGTSPLMKKEEVYVFGAVAAPGVYKFELNSNLIELLARAGGPTPDAKLNKVKHISVSHGTITVVEVNLEKYINTSIPVPMPVGAGDTIVIPRRGPPLVGTLIMTLITTTLTSIIFVLIGR